MTAYPCDFCGTPTQGVDADARYCPKCNAIRPIERLDAAAE